MKLHLVCADERLYPELCDLVRAYAPHIHEDVDAPEFTVVASDEGEYSVQIRFGEFCFGDTQPLRQGEDLIMHKRRYKRFAKSRVYRALRTLCGVSLPYGSLTGIRPTKLYYDLQAEGEDPKSMLADYFDVSPAKIQLIEDIVETQRGVYREDIEAYNHFANIPVCPTRCAYCSFIAEVYRRVEKQIPEYAKNLAEDVEGFFALGKRRRAIYVGGGTPTAIPAVYLGEILRAFHAEGEEFTVEAGRPETITPDHIAVMKEAGVTRVSVNPQSFKGETLARIGRAHTVEDIYKAYRLVKEAGFDVNMDLITMLPGESLEDFAATLSETLRLRPENITVHSLSIKRGSTLCLAGYDNAMDNELAEKMSEYAYRTLRNAGYRPYYMYRQKNTQGRLENVGYTLPGKACVYNVDIMEETHSIHASGAGAISKRVFPSAGRIERLAEIKEVKGYNERIAELVEKKKKFFAE